VSFHGEVGDGVGELAGVAEGVVGAILGRLVAGGREAAIADILDGVVVTFTQGLAAIGVAATVLVVAVRFQRGQTVAAFAPADLGAARQAFGVLEEQAIAAGAAIGLHGRFPTRDEEEAEGWMQIMCRRRRGLVNWNVEFRNGSSRKLPISANIMRGAQHRNAWSGSRIMMTSDCAATDDCGSSPVRREGP
jgi:hypothetical protein